jgi:hypothetical protein
MIDIREGDILIVGSKSYPVKAVEAWTKANWNTYAFKRMASITASTKRPPSMSAGGLRSGTATTNLTNQSITPLDPITAEVAERLALESPVRMLETFIADSTGFVHVIVEDLLYK